MKLNIFLSALTVALVAIACTPEPFRTGKKSDSGNGGKKKDSEDVRPDRAAELKDMVPIEKDPWFEEFTDPESKVVSYILKNSVVGRDNVQSNYFTNPTMTNDERFLFFYVSDNEYKVPSKNVGGVILDRLKRQIYKIDKYDRSAYPYMDVENDVLYCAVKLHKHEAYFFKRDLWNAAGTDIKLREFPPVIFPANEDNPLKRICSHVSLTRDKRRIWLDARINDEVHLGLYNLYPEDDEKTGLTKTQGWDEWYCIKNVNLDHGQLNPVRDDIALEGCDDLTTTDGTDITYKIPYADGDPDVPDGTYCRMSLITRGNKRTLMPSKENYATHEAWTSDGKCVYFCGKGINIRNIETGELIRPYYGSPAHAFLTKDCKYATFDDNHHFPKHDYRGCEWRVGFVKLKDKDCNSSLDSYAPIYIHSHIPAISPEDNPSTQHPDPHPQFVCNDKYILCTASQDDGNMHVSLTPVAPLIARYR